MNFLIYFFLVLFFLPRAHAMDYMEFTHPVTARSRSGDEILLPAETMVRTLVSSKKLANEELSISVTSSALKNAVWKTYSVNRNELFAAASVVMNSEKIRDYRGKKTLLPNGTRVAALARSSSYPGFLYSVLVNDHGEPLTGDLKSSTVYVPELAFLETKALNEVVLPNLKEKILLDVPGDFALECRNYPDVPIDTKTLPEIVYALNAADHSPFSVLMKYRRYFKSAAKSPEKCRELQRDLELKILAKSGWGNLALPDRARKIYELASDTFTEISAKGKELAGREGFDSEIDPHKFDPLLSPELATCISYTESERDLNPYGSNYQFCSDPPYFSTANGLNHVIESTVRLFKSYPQGNLVPLVAEKSRWLNEFGPTDLHRAASAVPEAQSEILFRVLNYELKHARSVLGRKAKPARILEHAIAQYDRDQESTYVRKVKACYSCMTEIKAKSGDVYTCYTRVLKQ